MNLWEHAWADCFVNLRRPIPLAENHQKPRGGCLVSSGHLERCQTKTYVFASELWV